MFVRIFNGGRWERGLSGITTGASSGFDVGFGGVFTFDSSVFNSSSSSFGLAFEAGVLGFFCADTDFFAAFPPDTDFLAGDAFFAGFAVGTASFDAGGFFAG